MDPMVSAKIAVTSLFLSRYLYARVAKSNFGKRFLKIKDCSNALETYELIFQTFSFFPINIWAPIYTSRKIPQSVENLSYFDHYKREKSYWAFKAVVVISLASGDVFFGSKSSSPIFAISMISMCCLSTDGLLTYIHLKNRGFSNDIDDNGLYFNDYPELRSLPRGLRVPSLKVENCPKFITLPEGIQVDGDIKLNNCPALTSLPENLRFGGDLSLFGCRGLTSLPVNITRLGYRSDGGIRTIDLTGTGLSDEYIDNRLRNERIPGMRFHFSREIEYNPRELTFNNLPEALNFWKAISPREAIPNLILEGEALTNMLTFLDRLANTAEYRNIRTQQPLATRVLDMVSCISQDEEMQEKALDLIAEGLISCDDRIIATLDDIELLEKIQEAERESPSPGSEEKLRSLGEALYKLEEVRKYARRHMANLNWVDEVEVQLGFQIGLTERLQLPLSTQNMIFRRCADVSDQQITDVGEEILRNCTERNINEFLQSWDPWKRHIRRKIIPDYEHLNSLSIDNAVQCEILHEVANRPVKCRNNVFDYEALCKVYVQSGQNPCTREPINWSDVKRLQIST